MALSQGYLCGSGRKEHKAMATLYNSGRVIWVKCKYPTLNGTSVPASQTLSQTGSQVEATNCALIRWLHAVVGCTPGHWKCRCADTLQPGAWEFSSSCCQHRKPSRSCPASCPMRGWVLWSQWVLASCAHWLRASKPTWPWVPGQYWHLFTLEPKALWEQRVADSGFGFWEQFRGTG